MVIVALAPVRAGAYVSQFQTMSLVWSVAGGDCAAVPMTLVSDYVWTCTVPVLRPNPAPADGALVVFQFMVDGDMQPAHFGYGGPGPFDVALGPNPPNLVTYVTDYGYHVFTLREQLLDCEVAAAPGSARATMKYQSAPDPVPDPVLAGTSADVFDQTGGQALGFFPYSSSAGAVVITSLLPGHTYRAVFAAPGYRSEEVIFLLPDAAPYDMMVTLAKLVSVTTASWGDIKNLYR